MIADRIKELRHQKSMTQSELARKIGITRSAVNAWELGISVPSTQYIVELAKLFNTTTDYILGFNRKLQIDISDYEYDEKTLIMGMLSYFDKRKTDE